MKIEVIDLKRTHKPINLLPGDKVEVVNNRDKPAVVWVSKSEWSMFGLLMNKLFGKDKNENS